jgi:uncharacterized RDD family membrane protein YckC
MTDVVTGEAVVLDLPVASFPSRMAALFIDVLVQVTVLIVAVLAIVAAVGPLNDDYLAAIWLSCYVVVVIGYPTVFETLSRGKTLGKLALGLRVVGDDGSPERFRQALVRALTGMFEIWTIALAPIALITSIVSAKGKRVGDIFAGTYVLQERMPARAPLPPVFAAVPPLLEPWALLLDVSRLSGQTADAAGSYLRRYHELTPGARDAIGIQLANTVAAQVSPPPPAGTPPAAYLTAVLAVRRQRDWARLAAMRPPAPQGQQQPQEPQEPQSAPPPPTSAGTPEAGETRPVQPTTFPAKAVPPDPGSPFAPPS